jgi:hypothetical protein
MSAAERGSIDALILILAFFFALPTHALEAENLLVAVPPGYKVGHQAKNAKQLISEMVPKAETVDTWTEMVTVLIYFGRKGSLIGYRTQMEKDWAAACAGAKSAPVGGGLVNGYTTMIWRQSCPLNKATGKPEITWFKAIAGNDSFYVVQKAFKFEPSPEQAATAVKYLDGVSVCDTRIAERKCPAGMR